MQNKYNLAEYENNFVVLDDKDRIISFTLDENVMKSEVSRYLSYREKNLYIYKLLDDDKKRFIKAILD